MTALQSAGKKKTAEVLKPTEVCTLGKSRRNQWVNFDVHSCPKVCFNLKVEEQGVLPPAWDCWARSLCNLSMSITDLLRKWSHVETETPWEQGQSDFPSRGVRDTLHHVPQLQSQQKRCSCPPAVEHPGGTWFLRPFGVFFTMIPPPVLSSPAVFPLPCFAHGVFRPKVSGWDLWRSIWVALPVPFPRAAPIWSSVVWREGGSAHTTACASIQHIHQGPRNAAQVSVDIYMQHSQFYPGD